MDKREKKSFPKNILLLHVILLLYAFSSVLAKLAAAQEFLSIPFILLYGGGLFIMLVYAILWQQILKRMPLTTAFANKPVVIIWGMLASAVFWHEKITLPMLLGTLLIILGVGLVVSEN